jgi:hypothetical protein
VITHNPQHAFWNLDIEGLQARRVTGEEIVLIDRLGVDGNATIGIAARDSIATGADNPLDEVR